MLLCSARIEPCGTTGTGIADAEAFAESFPDQEYRWTRYRRL